MDKNGAEVPGAKCSWCAKLGIPCGGCEVGALEHKHKRLSTVLARHQFSLKNLRALVEKLDKEDAEAEMEHDEVE